MLLVVVSLFDQPLILFKDRIKINALPEHPVALTIDTDLYFLCICILDQRVDDGIDRNTLNHIVTGPKESLIQIHITDLVLDGNI